MVLVRGTASVRRSHAFGSPPVHRQAWPRIRNSLAISDLAEGFAIGTLVAGESPEGSRTTASSPIS